ncbi:hypothetical protein [Thermoclostridium stercorarium]|uniref:hypothetical protein n=1 Tax=Thermoclostridium stercorarium TaxID=1510 RepID=UPI001F42A199|nr:hypothetical protein [Thermoclostridium stercorarium]
MNVLFFYASIVALLVIFFITVMKKKFTVRHMVLMLGYGLYNLIFELIFGEILGLYYYIEKGHSLVYTIIASLFLYPVIAILYVFYLPERKKVVYTAGFTVAALIMEIFSLYSQTIVLTGWRILPWSVISYMVSFYLINLFNSFLLRVLPEP